MIACSLISKSERKKPRSPSAAARPKQFGKGYYLGAHPFLRRRKQRPHRSREIFGPVASVIPFDGEADAIRIANDTPYGLAAAVWTRDIYKAFRVVKSLRAGIVWVNHMQPTYVEAPWGGYKQSGFGRELGPWGSGRILSKPSKCSSTSTKLQSDGTEMATIQLRTEIPGPRSRA